MTAPDLTTWLLATLLLATRLASMLLMAPPLNALPVPVTVRVMLLFALAAALAQPLLGDLRLQPASVAELARAVATEAVIGMVLGVALQLSFAAVQLAGRLLDVQIGFGMAQVMDPASRRPGSILGAMLPLTCVLVFFSVDGHHLLLRGLAFSVQSVPPGSSLQLSQAAPAVLAQGAALFTLGLSLALPVVLALLMADLLLAVGGRHLPQLNLMVLGFPVKAAIGLLALALWLPQWGPSMQRLQAGLFQAWSAALANLRSER